MSIMLSGLITKGQEKPAEFSKTSINMRKAPIGKGYFGNSLDGMIFSTSMIDNNGTKSLGTLRFSAWFHIGFTYNYNFSKSVGIYTGIDMKNIGYIEKFDLLNRTIKERVYTIGVPLGIRLGNMERRDYIFLGGGADLAVHYKRKYWDNTTKKQKSGEWFSERTEPILPYAFLGYARRGNTLKFQYYFGNFVNENYLDANNIPMYKGKNVNLLLLSFGRDMNYKRKKKNQS